MHHCHGHLHHHVLAKQVLVIEQRVLAHEARACALGVDAQDFLEGRVQEGACVAHGEDAEDALRRRRSGRGRDGGSFELGTDVVQEGWGGVDVDEHVESGRDCVGEDSEQGADFEAALVPEGDVVLGVRGVSGKDHCGALRLVWDVVLKVLLKCEAEGGSCISAFWGKEAWEHVQDEKVEIVVEVPREVLVHYRISSRNCYGTVTHQNKSA